MAAEECDHLVKKATARLHRSGVVEEGGGDGVSDIRTSDGMFFDRAEDPTIDAIENKVSEWTLIPPGNGEGFQVLRYQVTEKGGQEYRPHFDYFFHAGGIDNGGNRLATVLIYLNTVEEGGDTVFPNVKAPESQTHEAGFSHCASQGLAVRPRKGEAVAFWSLRTDGTLDKGSLHGSCPIIKGTKFAATKWYHVAHYAMGGETAEKVKHVVFTPPPPPAPPGCVDEHDECVGWAESGECDENPTFMVGREGFPGDCLRSCGRCDLMPKKANGKGGTVMAMAISEERR